MGKFHTLHPHLALLFIPCQKRRSKFVQYATPHSYCGNYCRWAACQPGATSTPTPQLRVVCHRLTVASPSNIRPSIFDIRLRLRQHQRPPNAGSTSPCSSFTLSSRLLATLVISPSSFYSLTPCLFARLPLGIHDQQTLSVSALRLASLVPTSRLATKATFDSPRSFHLRALLYAPCN